jgi:FKBP-type peptidyl-prolyl cis-trans isomerase
MKLLMYILIFGFLFSCEEEKLVNDKPIDWSKDKSTDFAKDLAFEEQINIQLYLKRRPQWKMTSTGTGLQYWIYDDVDGPTAKEGDIVEVNFEVKLLDDSLCYKTDLFEVSSFKVDKSDIESGVQEGIKFLSKGDKATFIIPSHLGHGLLGDMNKIPPLQALIVDIEVVDIK